MIRPPKEKGERGPKGFAELIAIAIRQGKAEDLTNLEMLAMFESALK